MPKIVPERIIDRNFGRNAFGIGGVANAHNGGGLTEEQIREIVRDEINNGNTGSDLADIIDEAIEDYIDNLTDTDGDGIPDIFDPDDDNDGIPDALEDYIRDFTGPIGTVNETGVLSLTVPVTTMTGDTIYIVVAHGIAAPEDFTPAGFSTAGTDGFGIQGSAWGDAELDERPFNYGGFPGAGIGVFYKIAAGTPGEISTDAGDTVEITFRYNDYTSDFSSYSPFNPIAYVYVFKNEAIEEPGYSDFLVWDYYSELSDPFENFAPTIDTSTTNELVLYMSANQGSVTYTANSGVGQLVSISNGTVSLFIGYKFIVSPGATDEYQFTPSSSPHGNVAAACGMKSV